MSTEPKNGKTCSAEWFESSQTKLAIEISEMIKEDLDRADYSGLQGPFEEDSKASAAWILDLVKRTLFGEAP